MKPKTFLLAYLATTVWINLAEAARYIKFVQPSIQEHFAGQTGIAAMDRGIFGIWLLWDAILTFVLVYVVFLTFCHYRRPFISALISGSLIWVTFFVLYWLAMLNMGLTNPNLLLITLPWTFFEMLAGARITIFVFRKCQPEGVWS